jgi:hypothetical protein
MSASQSATSNPSAPAGSSVAYIIQWLRELEECRKGGLVTDEDYAIERAEKLSELLEQHQGLWLATFFAFVPVAAAAAGLGWWLRPDWQSAATAGGLAGVVSLLTLSGMVRERMKHSKARERLSTLRTLLEHDLISTDEFVVYEERLLGGVGGR